MSFDYTLPNGWAWETIDSIKAEGRSIVSGPFGSAIGSRFFVESGVPVIRGNNLKLGMERFFDGGFVFLSEEKALDFKNCEAVHDDIILTAAGTIGQVGIIPKTSAYPKYIISNKQIRVRTDQQKVMPLFVYYWLSSSEMINTIQSRNTGSTIPLINLSVVKSLPIPVPPLKTQKAIVEILGCLDDRIALLRETNTTLEAIAQALFKSWFVDFDPVLYNSSANAGTQAPSLPAEIQALFPSRLVESPQGLIPEGWEWSTIAQSFILTMGQSPPGDTYNEIGDGLPFYQGKTDYGFRFPTQRVFCTSPTRLAHRGDCLVSVRAPVGDVNVALENCALGRGIAGVRHPRSFTSYVLYTLQLLKPHFEYFNGEGTVFGSINKKDFQNLPVIEAPESVLQAFDEIVSGIDAQIENNELKLRTLVNLRDTLLPRLISGQLRLPEAEAALAEVAP